MTAVDSNRRANAVGFGSKPQPKRLRLTCWKAVAKGSLRGFATIKLAIGLKVVNCPVFVSNGKAWATLPSKPLIDKECRQKTDVNGKSAYVSILKWRSCELSDRFSATVVELVRREHPGALEDESTVP